MPIELVSAPSNNPPGMLYQPGKIMVYKKRPFFIILSGLNVIYTVFINSKKLI